jgi:hypothetical protein
MSERTLSELREGHRCRGVSARVLHADRSGGAVFRGGAVIEAAAELRQCAFH